MTDKDTLKGFVARNFLQQRFEIELKKITSQDSGRLFHDYNE